MSLESLFFDEYNYNNIKKEVMKNFKGNISELFNLICQKSYFEYEEAHRIIDFIYELLGELDIYEISIINIQVRNSLCKLNYILKQNSETINIIKRLEKIKKLIVNVKNSKANYNKIAILKRLIFETKNLDLLEKYLHEENNIFNNSFKYLNDLYMELFTKYLNSSEEEYYFLIIRLMLKYDISRTIINNKLYYIKLLGNNNTSKYKKLISLIDGNNCNDEMLANQFKIRLNPSEEIMESSKKLKMNKHSRLDYTNQHFITIDGEGTRCFDDAIYLRKNKNGTYTLFVAIADVSSSIKYGSDIYEYAHSLGETLYLCDKNILMYDENISYDKLSLLKDKKRNVIMYIVDIDANGDVLEDTFRIRKGVIKVAHQLDYKSADNILQTSEDIELMRMIHNLSLMSLKWKSDNPTKELYRKVKNLYNVDKKCEFLPTDNYVSANIIQETMVLINYLAAKYFRTHNLPYLRRAFSPITDNELNRQLDSIIASIDGFEEKLFKDKYLKQALIRHYLPAYYTTSLLGHNGIDKSDYSHSTSPLRRLSDTDIQYATNEMYFDRDLSDRTIYIWETRLKNEAKYLNDKHKQNEMFAKEYNKIKTRIKGRS